MSTLQVVRRLWGILVAVAVALGAVAVVPISTASAVGNLSTVNVGLTPVATGLTAPLAVAWRSGDTSMYVAEQRGRVRRVLNGTIAATALTIKPSTGGERGLLGLTFGPTGKMYVDYTDKNGDTRVEEFGMNAAKKAVKKTRRPMLFQKQPFANHNGGGIAFGPDGDLYIALGDGGSGGDPNGNAQNPNSLLGKILRISPTPAYGYPTSIPLNNPFVGQSGKRWEVWMYGLRNPFRFSFDSANGDMWIGDVGQALYEEIDYAAAGQQAGINWGWNRREGLHPYNGGTQPPGGRDPVIERDHTTGDCAITGGYVYRGAAIPALVGAYIYGDYCTGKVYAAEQQAGAIVQNVQLNITVPQLASFGQDLNGEVYAVSQAGTVFKITAA